MKQSKNIIEKQTRFAIKKLSVGAAAVLVSTGLYLGVKSGNVSADTTNGDAATSLTKDSSNQSTLTTPSTPETQSANGQDAATGAATSQNNQTTQADTKNDAQNEKQNPEVDTTLTSAPLYTTENEVPTLDPSNMFTKDQLNQFGPDVTATWEAQPDVSKIGDTKGTAKLTYEDMNADTPSTKDILVNVPVLVREGQKLTENQVVNSINVVNSDDNSLVAHYDWVGNKGDDQTEIPYSDDVEASFLNIFKELGFDTDNVEFPDDLITFGDKNKTATIFVKPSSKDPVISDSPYFTVGNGNSTVDNVNGTPNAQNYIGNLGVLPTGTTFEWNVAPKYDYTKDEDGNYINPEPTNDPSITVTIPGQKPIILSGDDLKSNLGLPAYGDATLLLNSDNQLKVGETAENPIKYITNTAQFLQEYFANNGEEMTPDAMADLVNSFQWTIAPNTNQPGYTIGVFNYNGTTGNMILFKVVDSTNGGAADQPENPQIPEGTPDQPQTPPSTPTNTPQPQTPDQQPQKDTNTPVKAQHITAGKKSHALVKQYGNVKSRTVATQKQTVTASNTTTAASKATLPQTGSKNDDLAAIGLGMSAMAGILSLLGFKKKGN